MARIKDRTRQERRVPVKAAVTAGEPANVSETMVFRTATYARLSVDSRVSESDSITSQQMLMRDYIKGRNEFFLVREYKDDGVSGTRFDRQAFESLLREVRKGSINCIIVKDFSRFGRDHIEVGKYLEKVFPFLGVRFISVNDGYDSFDKDCADKKMAVILKNLVNEYIAKDISVKAASAYMTKQESGEYDGGCAPYGYVFADGRKTRFAVDKKAAEIVKDIFAWTIQGDSALAIVKRLTERNINPPKAYRTTGNIYRQEKERCYWNEYTVNNILRNMAYAGHMALHKGKESKADGISSCKLDETAWIITRNTHEAIVPKHDFGIVQAMLKARKEKYQNGNAPDENSSRPENLLKGKVFCGDCLVPAARMGTNYRRKSGKIRVCRYRCRTYKDKGAKECTPKSISEKQLEDIACQAVMGIIRQAECLDAMISRFHGGFFRRMREHVEKEMRMEKDAIRQGRNEKILLYKKYSGMKYSAMENAGADRFPGENGRNGNQEWYLKEKQKKEDEIRYHEERIIQLEEKTAFLERLEREQAGWMKEALICQNTFSEEAQRRLAVQMASVFIDKIYLYDGKRVEVVMNFKNKQIKKGMV